MSCEGCRSCYKGQTLCNVAVTTLAEQNYVVTTVNRNVSDLRKEFQNDLNQLSDEIGDAVKLAQRGEEELYKTQQLIDALSIKVGNLTISTTAIQTEQINHGSN
jgi:archaellum component FlaC